MIEIVPVDNSSRLTSIHPRRCFMGSTEKNRAERAYSRNRGHESNTKHSELLRSKLILLFRPELRMMNLISNMDMNTLQSRTIANDVVDWFQLCRSWVWMPKSVVESTSDRIFSRLANQYFWLLIVQDPYLCTCACSLWWKCVTFKQMEAVSRRTKWF